MELLLHGSSLLSSISPGKAIDPTQACENVPATVFEDVLAKRSDYQNAVLKRLEVLSFSFNPEWSLLHPCDLLNCAEAL